MFDLLRGMDPVAALPGAFAAGSQVVRRVAEPDEPDLPILIVVVALCEPRRIALAWVGNDKAYLLPSSPVRCRSKQTREQQDDPRERDELGLLLAEQLVGSVVDLRETVDMHVYEVDDVHTLRLDVDVTRRDPTHRTDEGERGVGVADGRAEASD